MNKQKASVEFGIPPDLREQVERQRHECEVRQLLAWLDEPGKGRAFVLEFLNDPLVAGRRERLRTSLNEALLARRKEKSR